MKKKKITKKLSLNKETVAGLDAEEMKKIKGASILAACSDSCSVLVICCDTLSRTDCVPKEKMAKG